MKHGTAVVGKEALEQFHQSLIRSCEDDATGNTYVITRGSDATLGLAPLSHEAAGALATALTQNISSLEKYDLVVIDSGNSAGDSWKAIFHPQKQVFTFISEAPEGVLSHETPAI